MTEKNNKKKKKSAFRRMMKKLVLSFGKKTKKAPEKLKEPTAFSDEEAASAKTIVPKSDPTRLVDMPADNGEYDDTGSKIAKETAKATFGTVWIITRKLLTYALNLLLTVLLVALITGASVALAFVVYIKNYIDPEYTGLDNLKFDSSLSTSMYYLDSDGIEVELIDDRISGSENRLWVAYNDIPKNLINACIAVEDQRFITHNGVDAKRTLSALYNFFIPTRSNYGGGSTITQQLIKNVSGENQTTIQRKVQEIFRAFNVEKKFTKTEILEMYLNTIYLSQNCNGVRTAALTYFGKDVSELTLVECAALASIGKSPIAYDPLLNPKNNLQRRNLVLKLMLEQGKITEEEFLTNYDAPLILATDEEDDDSAGVKIHSYYIDTVLDDVTEALMQTYDCDITTASRMLFSGGLQIVTCENPVIQSIVEEIFTTDGEWTTVTGAQAQSAICVMDHKSGDLLAIVGGRGEKKTSRGLNRATMSKRQCGSSIKPLSVYSLAIEKGLLFYGSSVDDVPQIFYEGKEEGDTGTYWPYNYDKTFYGKMSFSYAVQRSLNTVAVNTCMRLGVDAVFDHLVNGLGFTTLVESMTYDDGTSFSDRQISPLALGSFTYGVTTREMTQAYATLANGGIFTQSRTFSQVRDNKGNVIIDNTPEQRIVYEESTAYITTCLMEGVVSGPYGTSRNDVDFYEDFEGLEACGKTGTTNDNKDQYFCGYTPDYTAACWFGYDNNKTIVSSGGNPATKAWNAVYRRIYEYHESNGIPYTAQFTVPANVVTGVDYCTISGKVPTEACNADLGVLNGERRVVYHDGVYTKDTVPTELCDCHIMVNYDNVTKAVCLNGCNCPTENQIQVSLRKVDRLLYKNIKIGDAQCLWYPIPDSYTPPLSEYASYWRECLPEGIFIGYTSGTKIPLNRVCKEHWVGIPIAESSADTSADSSSDTSSEVSADNPVFDN